MKNLIILLSVTLLSTNFIFGQRVWHNETGSIAGSHFNILSTCGDTLINDEVWTKLETIFAGILPPPQIFDSLTFISQAGMITEQDGIIELMDMDARTRRVLYNFNLEVGDSTVSQTGVELVVTSVDSMLVANEFKKRITLFNSKFDFEDIWVETIGSIKNYFLMPGEPQFAPDAGSDLICVSIDGNLILETPASRDNCLFEFFPDFIFPCLGTGTNASKDLSDFNLDLEIFPNPFGAVINVESSTPFQRIEVFDLNGKIIAQRDNLQNSTSLELDSSQFPSGMYLLKAIATDGTFGRATIMKNRE